MMKKIISALLVLTFALTGCSSEAKPEETTGKIVIGVDKGYIPYFTEIKASFEAETGIQVELVETDMFDVIDNLATQKGNSADLFMIPVDRIGSLSDQKLIDDIGIELTGFGDLGTTASKYNNVNYFVPMSVESLLLMYNKSLVTESDLPNKLSDLSADEFAATFTDFYHAAGMFHTFGASIFTDETYKEVALNSENAIKAGKAIQAKYNSGNDLWSLMKDDSTAGTTRESSFMDGKVKFVIDGPWSINKYVEAGVDLGVMVIPSWDGTNDYRTLGGVKGMALNNYSANKDAAKKFLEYLATPENAKKFHEMTLEVSAHNSVSYEAGSNYQIIYDATQVSLPMPAATAFGKVWTPMADALKQIATGADVKEALDAAVSTINKDIADMQE